MGITISNSQCLWLGFSLKNTPQHMWVMVVYIVWVRIECIINDNLAKQNVSWESLTRENQLSPSCPDSSHSSHVQGTCITSREAYSRASRENSFSFQLALSLYTLFLSHTTLTNKTHVKYKVQKIEHNYNQIWHGIKANKIHSCKLQLYTTNFY